MRKLLLALLSLALTSSVGAQSCCDSKNQYFHHNLGSQSYYPGLGVPNVTYSGSACSTNCTLDAADEMLSAMGYIEIDGHPSTAKTCSSSGCKIYWRLGAYTPGTSYNLRVGIQDVSTTTGPPAQPDETFDVYGDTTSGVQNTVITTTMSSGTKSITDGDLIAIVSHLTAVNGASLVQTHVVGGTIVQHFPNVAYKLGGGSWAMAASNQPNMMIEFDDGTLGWLKGSLPYSAFAGQTFNVDSASVDERMMACRFDAPVRASGMYAYFALPSNADVDVVLYKNACDGCTPTAVVTKTITDNMVSNAGSNRLAAIGFPQQFLTGWWAVSLKPTATTNITATLFSVSSNSWLKALGGTNCYAATRVDSGAITHTNTGYLPVGFILDAYKN